MFLTLLVIFIQIPLGLVNYFQFQKGKINQVQSEFEWEWLCVSKLSYKVIFKDFFLILHTFPAICNIFKNLTFLTFMTSNIIQGLVESIMNKIIFIEQKNAFFHKYLNPLKTFIFLSSNPFLQLSKCYRDSLQR